MNHTATRTLFPLSYSDGAQYSLSHLDNGGVRVPDPAGRRLRAAAELPRLGQRHRLPLLSLFNLDVAHARAPFDIYDMDRDGITTKPRRDLRRAGAAEATTGISTPMAPSPTTSATRTPTA